MKTFDELDFTGVRLMLNPPPTDLLTINALMYPELVREEIEIMRITHDLVDQLALRGMEVTLNTRKSLDNFSSDIATDQTYALEVLSTVTQAAEHDFFENEGRHIKRPNVVPYIRFDRTAIDRPIVVASRGSDGGYGKYLVETSDQLDKIDQLADNIYQVWGMRGVREGFEVREFIPTPSDRYTSYRVVAAADGGIIAAGLLYSDHTEDQRQKVTTALPWEPDVNRSYLSALENPESPYYLGALDARSNLAQGGHVIPLMGAGQARSIDTAERAIAAAHGIDPDNLRLPADLFEQASFMASKIAKYYGIAIGMDYLQHADTGQFYHIENNAGPGADTVSACWNGGKDLSSAESQRLILEKAFTQIANSRAVSRL